MSGALYLFEEEHGNLPASKDQQASTRHWQRAWSFPPSLRSGENSPSECFRCSRTIASSFA